MQFLVSEGKSRGKCLFEKCLGMYPLVSLDQKSSLAKTNPSKMCAQLVYLFVFWQSDKTNQQTDKLYMGSWSRRGRGEGRGSKREANKHS